MNQLLMIVTLSDIETKPKPNKILDTHVCTVNATNEYLDATFRWCLVFVRGMGIIVALSR